MRVGEFLEILRGMDGVIMADVMPVDLIQEVAEMETSIDCISGGMRLENIGLFQCLHREEVIVLLSDGVVRGHDVPGYLREELS